MSYKIKGTITHIGDIQTFDSGSKKIQFVIDSGEQYNNLYAFDLFKGADHVKFVENFTQFNKVGDVVEVEFNVNCHEYQGKYYTNLSCWKCEKVGGNNSPTEAETETFVAEGDDDLPF